MSLKKAGRRTHGRSDYYVRRLCSEKKIMYGTSFGANKKKKTIGVSPLIKIWAGAPHFAPNRSTGFAECVPSRCQ
eukprot:1349905-Amphidinium_carterae.1